MTYLRGILTKIGLLLIFCLVILIFFLIKPFNNYELAFYDLRFKLRPALSMSEEIVLIEISDDTLKNLGTWPLPRDFHASLLDVLREYGAKMVVFDIIFSEPTLYDGEFARSIQEAKNVYLPLVFYLEDKSRDNIFPVDSSYVLADLVGELAENASGIGHINVMLDSDGKVRKVPLFIKQGGRLIPQLAFKAVCDKLGLNTNNIAIKGNKLVIDRSLSLPVIGNNYFLVNYPQKWEKSFKHFSYFEILKSYAQKKEGKDPDLDLSELKGKVCFIGLTAAGTSDFQPVPLENIYPLVGLQASIFNSLMNKEFITYVGFPFNIFFAFLVFFFSLAICLWLKPLKSFLGSLVFATAYFSLSVAVFIIFGLWIDLFLPLFIILVNYIVVSAYRFFAETKKRELLEQELDIARAIQKSFLPSELKEFSGLGISSFMLPAKFVAGDLYDFVKIDDRRLGLFIADVSGKGVPASLIMAQTISFFRIFARQYADCAKVLALINKELCGKTSARFVTAMYIIVDTTQNKVYVSSAGHSPLLLYRKKTNTVAEVEINAGMPLGIMDEAGYENVPVDIESGDKIVIFTDGLTDARDVNNQEFGCENVKKIISENGTKKAEQLSELIIDRVKKFSMHRSQHDDITLIICAR
ncbi:MAG: CHASE2 domain-containing protein [Candidatus Omnitrophica bacterium]|nr:CHASE2 domain-containing protein [Candidatus Omnitrophota bacterium]